MGAVSGLDFQGFKFRPVRVVGGVVSNWASSGWCWHYNNSPFPWRHVGVFPSDMSLGKGIPSDMSLGNTRWGSFVRDSFPSDNPQRREGDVVLRQSYKPESYGKLYYACPKSKPPKHFGCGFFLWKETRLRELMSSPGAPSTPSYSAGHSTHPSNTSGPSTPPTYSSGPSTPTNYSLGSSRNRECSNCKHLRGKISVLKATMEMHMHPEQHTVNSAALFHEVLNEMEKLDLE
ncbi:hypothetical protein Tco_0446575 [Tanacetum coccineum]